MRNAIGKFLLLVAVGVVAIACKDNKPKTPSTYKIEVNIEQGEKYAHIMDSVEILYYDKDLRQSLFREYLTIMVSSPSNLKTL